MRSTRPDWSSTTSSLLSSGDRVSADLRVVEAHALTMDTSLLTGESAAVPARDGDALLAGTFVVEGEAEAVVEATGGRTRLAAIAELTQAGERPRSPLAHELDRVVRVVALIALGVGVAFFGIAAGGRHSGLGRVPVRDRGDGRARTGGVCCPP